MLKKVFQKFLADIVSVTKNEGICQYLAVKLDLKDERICVAENLCINFAYCGRIAVQGGKYGVD